MSEKNTEILQKTAAVGAVLAGAALAGAAPAGPAPVDQWHPPLLGEMDLRIARDGTWYHEGQPIARQALVRLFARILRHDSDGCYYLVTPVERWRICVEDAPFLAVEMAVERKPQWIHFRTNVDDWVTAGPEHPLQIEYPCGPEQPAPYVHIRGRLRARLTRSVFLELAEYAVLENFGGREVYGVYSQGVFFPLE